MEKMQKLKLRMQKLNLRMQKLNFPGTHCAWTGLDRRPKKTPVRASIKRLDGFSSSRLIIAIKESGSDAGDKFGKDDW